MYVHMCVLVCVCVCVCMRQLIKKITKTHVLCELNSHTYKNYKICGNIN